MKKALVLTALSLVSAAALVGQAGAAGASPAAAKATSVVRVTAVASGLKFNTKVLRAKAGRIQIVFTNASAVPHDVRIENGEKELGGTKTIGKGRAVAFVTLKRGQYNFYCSVPGHEDAGMKGKLIVS